MEKRFVEREKMSKKQRKALDAQGRKVWELPPVSKKVESRKVYNRKRFDRVGMNDSRSA